MHELSSTLARRWKKWSVSRLSSPNLICTSGPWLLRPGATVIKTTRNVTQQRRTEFEFKNHHSFYRHDVRHHAADTPFPWVKGEAHYKKLSTCAKAPQRPADMM